MNKLLHIGYDRKDNTKKIMFIEKKFGVTSIIAPARYGKSILLRNLTVEIINNTDRSLLFFDYRGEHEDLKRPNLFTKDIINAIPYLKTITNFAFMVSDYDTKSDWVSMGFSDGASSLLAKWVREEYNRYQDNPYMFKDVIDYFKKGNHAETIKSLNKFENIINFFYNPYEKRQTRNYIDFTQELQDNKYIHVDLNLRTEADIWIARTQVGKILQKLAKKPYILKKLKPLIVFEEADFLCPQMSQDDKLPSSLIQAQDYVLKQQRNNPHIIFVAQDPKRLNDSLIKNTQTFLLGNLGDDNTKWLKWNVLKNYREFKIVNIGHDRYGQAFVPLDSSTAIT